ncbi:MAG: cation diffusion facilitator family transporter [Lachnospiraceae bacterium]|nr:cation diffusion facilitator family transporter [Lachnospiraceae bacterium]
MIRLLAMIFIKDRNNQGDMHVRHAYGVLCGAFGVFLNLVLFGMKLMAGLISGSVAIIADAINNLSDAGSSVISMVGFKMAGQKPDPEHPFGHGRIEYVTGLAVSMLIIVMGFELLKTSVSKIRNPQMPEFTPVVAGFLIVSIIIKLYMFYYNTKVGKKIKSAAMNATALDSFTDSIATLVVLACSLISYYTGVIIDGWCGLAVSLFVLSAGLSAAKDTIDPLLGSKPSQEYVDAIEKFVTSYKDIIGIHDLVVHDYGPGRIMISLHAEVPADRNMLDVHDTIDNIERKINEKLGCSCVIHMDPVVTNDPATDRMKRLCELIAKSVDERFTIHDFRMVKGPSHTNLIFDVVAPFDCRLSEDAIRNTISAKIESLPGNHFAVINVDRPYC